jgi:hypothetical protein
MSKLVTFIILSMVVVSISGCYSVKTIKMGHIRKQDKIMEVPATGFSIMDIKAALIRNGWKLKVTNNNVERIRHNSDNPKIDSSNDYDAAYRLIISESVRADSWVIGLSASVVDTLVSGCLAE